MWTKIMLMSVIVCLISGLAAAQAAYTITDLGQMSPTAINSWAQVVGNDNNQAYIWAFGRMQSLATLPGGTFSQASGINDLGVVVGTADGQGTVVVPPDNFFGYTGPNEQCSDLTQPFIWKTQMQGLGTLGPESDVEEVSARADPSDLTLWCHYPFYGSGINNLGEVIGYTGDLGDLFQWGILWSPSGGMSIFGSSWPATFPNQISNTGQTVGQTGRGYLTATSWKDGVATDLGGLPGGDFLTSGANGVNDLGEIVGWSYNAGIVHAVIWTKDGVISDLGTLPGDAESVAKKINLFGLVIGNSGTTLIAEPPITGIGISILGPFDVVGRAFVWSQRSGMLDLNTLIPANSGWVLNTATDINVWGQIVGNGTLNGQPHGFLMTPKVF